MKNCRNFLSGMASVKKLISTESAPIPIAPYKIVSVGPKVMPALKKLIKTANAPIPIAPYNQAVVLDNTVYVSGCLGIDKDTMKLVEGGAEAEARQALKNLGHILAAADSKYENVIKTTVFLNDISDFQAVNNVYKEFFAKDFPARSAFQVGQLPMNAKVEIEVVAAAGKLKIICCH